jgi:hypothetical protein
MKFLLAFIFLCGINIFVPLGGAGIIWGCSSVGREDKNKPECLFLPQAAKFCC